MKITLDLTRLRAEGRITEAEETRLLALSEREAASLALNLLVGFGVLAVSSGALALVPNPLSAVGLGALLLIAGALLLSHVSHWRVLGNMVLLVAALLFGGGLVLVAQGALAAYLVVAAVFAITAIYAGSALLAVLAVLALGGALDAQAGYSHALYALRVPQPSLTVLAFSALALGLYRLSRAVGPLGERLSLVGARAALFMVNLGFWIGSLWGDHLRLPGAPPESRFVLPDLAFVVAWAVGLAAIAAWAMRENRRWVFNLAAIFGGIHFYTQWFERLGATPLSLLLGGLALLALALGLWRWNGRFSAGA